MAITRQHIHKVSLRGAMTGIIPPTEVANWAQKGNVTDKKGIPISAVIASASTHDTKAATDVIDNAVIKKRQQEQQPTSSNPSAKTNTIKQHLCLDRAYGSKVVERRSSIEDMRPMCVQEKERGAHK